MYQGVTVYVVVHVVSDAMASISSYLTGRWEVATRADKAAAEELATRYNRARYIQRDDLHYYTVEQYHDYSTNRPPLERGR
jgi:hypothetical protein